MFDAFTLWQLTQIAGLGLVAGTLGGMLGVGGSVVMIPGLVWVLGRPTGAEQHVYQAAAMVANVAVAVPAALRHRRAGAMVPDVLRWMLPAAVGCVLLGVWLSNLPVFAGREGGVWLGRVLAVFLGYVIYINLRKLLAKPATRAVSTPPAVTGEREAKPDRDPLALPPRRAAAGGLAVGTIMGTTAGLLGIGGGALAVPLAADPAAPGPAPLHRQQLGGHLRQRRAGRGLQKRDPRGPRRPGPGRHSQRRGAAAHRLDHRADAGPAAGAHRLPRRPAGRDVDPPPAPPCHPRRVRRPHARGGVEDGGPANLTAGPPL